VSGMDILISSMDILIFGTDMIISNTTILISGKEILYPILISGIDVLILDMDSNSILLAISSMNIGNINIGYVNIETRCALAIFRPFHIRYKPAGHICIQYEHNY
jgi:hypothetical protein